MDPTTSRVAALTAAAASCLFLAAAIEEEIERTSVKKKRRKWVKDFRKTRKPILNTRNLLKEPQPGVNDHILGIDQLCFNKLLAAIKEDVGKRNTLMREAVSLEEKLAVSLRFLATGESYMRLSCLSKLSKSFIAEAIIDVCAAIYNNLKDEFLKFPTDVEEWVAIAERFDSECQFPLCVGALGAKHIAFTPAKEDAPMYLNENGDHSMILLALADAEARLSFVNFDYPGSMSNKAALQYSYLASIIDGADDFLPPMQCFENGSVLPYVFVADGSFPLKENLMIPYAEATAAPKLAYNRHLRRAEERVRHVFKLLASRFQVLQNPIKLKKGKAKTIVLSCCVLHNFLIAHSRQYLSMEVNNVSDNKSAPVNYKYSEESEAVRSNWVEFFHNRKQK